MNKKTLEKTTPDAIDRQSKRIAELEEALKECLSIINNNTYPTELYPNELLSIHKAKRLLNK